MRKRASKIRVFAPILSTVGILVLLGCVGEPPAIEQPPSVERAAPKEIPAVVPEEPKEEEEKPVPPVEPAAIVEPAAPDLIAMVKPREFPNLRVTGLYDGFTFSVPAPRIRWKVRGEALPVRVELSLQPTFPTEGIVFQETTSETSVQLPSMEEGKIYYVRLGLVLGDEVVEESQETFRVFYKPFSIPMLPVLPLGETVTFPMGFDGGLERERPEHPVTLTRPFALGVYEVTNEEFAVVMNRLLDGGIVEWKEGSLLGPRGIPLAGVGELHFGEQFGFSVQEGRIVATQGRERHPVVGVSWYGAMVFCFYLSIMEGMEPAVAFDPEDPETTVTLIPTAEGYRLPTEAEWEYAARGVDRRLYPDRVLNPTGVNFFRSGDPFEGRTTISEAGGPTTPVGYYDGSIRAGYRTRRTTGPFGHFDLSGNVWEWCWDWFDPGYYRSTPREDSMGPTEGSLRVVRGGAWNTPRQDLRLTMRGFYPPRETSFSLGFRIARTLK